MVVGHAAVINAGEFISATGWWINDREHGLQFKAPSVFTPQPTTLEGIKKYLGLGMIRGIGQVYVKALVAAFGEAVLDLIEQEPGRLREVTGIGAKRASRIVAGWADQKVIREIMLFLHANGVGTPGRTRVAAAGVESSEPGCTACPQPGVESSEAAVDSSEARSTTINGLRELSRGNGRAI